MLLPVADSYGQLLLISEQFLAVLSAALVCWRLVSVTAQQQASSPQPASLLLLSPCPSLHNIYYAAAAPPHSPPADRPLLAFSPEASQTSEFVSLRQHLGSLDSLKDVYFAAGAAHGRRFDCKISL